VWKYDAISRDIFGNISSQYLFVLQNNFILILFINNLVQINPHLEIDTKAIWEYSLMVLDCVFIHSDEFYKRISVVAHGRQGKHAPRFVEK